MYKVKGTYKELGQAPVREWRMGSPVTRPQLAEVGTPTTVNVPSNNSEDISRGISEEEIQNELVKAGLIQIPIAGKRPCGDFNRIDVGGKPISEMIVEERR